MSVFLTCLGPLRLFSPSNLDSHIAKPNVNVIIMKSLCTSD